MNLYMINRMWKKTCVSNGHWLWMAGKDKTGYGYIWFNGKATAVHRLSLCIYLGLNYNDLHWLACHTSNCEFRNCWNPTHLYQGDYSTNARDWHKVGESNKRYRKGIYA